MKTLLPLFLFASLARGDESTKLDNWHQWRGPLANGTAPKADPPISWSDTKNIKWKVELPGNGSATPIIWQDRVFIVAAANTGRKAGEADLAKVDPKFERKTTAPTTFYRFTVVCYDRNTGKELWKDVAAEKVPHEGTHDTHTYAAGSPTTDGQRLYVSFGSIGIYCYDLNGKQLWKRDLGRMITRLGWGEAVTPVIQGDSLLLNWDQEANSALYCLNAKNGETKWKAERPGEKTSWNTPLVVEHKGKTLVIMNGTGRARAYDLADGKVVWEVAGMTTNAIPSAVADTDTAYIVSGYRGAAAVAVPLDAMGDLGESKEKVRWRYGKGTPYVPSPLLAGNRLYFTQANGNSYTILDTKTGKPVLDQERLPTVKNFYGSPMAAAGRIYLVDRDGVGLVLKQADTVEVLATNRLSESIDSSPAIAGKQLFLRGHKNLYCIEE